MAGYVIVNTLVTDPEKYDQYKPLAAAAVAQYGGRYLARGGAMECVEGSWPQRRIVLIEFPTVEHARRWWFSPEYEAAKRVRQGASTGDIIIIEGA
ncbi:MAG TPA: DUF1330 domain-containing protein [Ktedonobacterales bacterium]|nr:DUF1330 domain-containing protein [Ktedonobacterales bacterium]